MGGGNYMYNWNDGTYLKHHGIKGQKWGQRRYQNEDGSLTAAGKERYGVALAKYGKADRLGKKLTKQINKAEKARQKTLSSRNKFSKELKDDNTKSLAKSIISLQYQKMNKKDAVKDYEEGTKTLNKGYEEYKNIIKNYGDVKFKSYADSSFKKSPEYKDAVKKYVNQRINDIMGYGVDYSAIIYGTRIDENPEARKHENETWSEKPSKRPSGNI